jgi:hypothetical protein
MIVYRSTREGKRGHIGHIGHRYDPYDPYDRSLLLGFYHGTIKIAGDSDAG